MADMAERRALVVDAAIRRDIALKAPGRNPHETREANLRLDEAVAHLREAIDASLHPAS